MSHENERIIALGATEEFRYIGIHPELDHKELLDIRTTLPSIEGVNTTKANGPNTIEAYYDGSTSIGFCLERTPKLREDDVFVAYAEKVAEHVGAAAIHLVIAKIGPGSIVAQAVHNEEPGFRQTKFRLDICNPEHMVQEPTYRSVS